MILYGYTADRPSGVPHDFKVFARLGFLKGTLPEGLLWEHVWWRVTREHPSKDIIEPAPMDPNLADECVRQTLFEPTDTIAELCLQVFCRQACPLQGQL